MANLRRQTMMRRFLVGVCILLISIRGEETGHDNGCGGESLSPYMIVIDGGSTGSRLHVFHFTEDDHDVCVCTRKGSSRANVPLSAFAPTEGQDALDPTTVAAHLLPLFEFAATVIPPSYYNTTVARYEATAGMRLLTPPHQEMVYDALYEGLMASPTFVFRGMKRSDIETLSGDLEGYYGAVAANYLSGIIDANLHVIHPEDEHVTHRHPIGALDMGGSSTQIVYLTEQIDNGNHSCANDVVDPPSNQTTAEAEEEEQNDPQTCLLRDQTSKKQLQGENFFSTSYLAYGVDQFRERLWNTLIEEHLQERQQDDNSDSCDPKIIPYPCGFHGHQIQWGDYTLFGMGDAQECARQVQRLLPHAEEATDNHQDHAGKVVGGIQHPTVQGKFFAMSLYFFTLDSLRVLSHPHEEAHEALNSAWPRPSIQELTDALEGLCARKWKGDLEEIQHHAHEFTRAEVLPHRCFESVYMVTLLRDGFGFHPESRDITFTFLVDGSEVEWSLGMALSLRSDMKTVETISKDAMVVDNSNPVTCNETGNRHSAVVVVEEGGSSFLPPMASVVTTSG